MARIGIGIIFMWLIYSCSCGFVASGAQCMFGIFAIGLRMAIKLNHVKLTARIIRNANKCYEPISIYQLLSQLFVIRFS